MYWNPGLTEISSILFKHQICQDHKIALLKNKGKKTMLLSSNSAIEEFPLCCRSMWWWLFWFAGCCRASCNATISLSRGLCGCLRIAVREKPQVIRTGIRTGRTPSVTIRTHPWASAASAKDFKHVWNIREVLCGGLHPDSCVLNPYWISTIRTIRTETVLSVLSS